MSTILDKIIEAVQKLPPDERRQLRELLNDETRDSEQARRIALSRIIRGKYAHLNTSSADFAAQKAEEMALEDRHSGARSRRL